MVQKNFTITNGLEVNTNLIFADTNSNKVGIATTNVRYTLDVKGGIGATGVYVGGDINVDGDINLGGRIGINSVYGLNGSYLISTGIGVSWASLPGLRFTQTYTATASQTTFSFSYNPAAGVDVYVNGVRLSSSEYTATSGTSIILDDGCFAGDTVDLIAYSVASLGVGNTGITGVTIADKGTIVGNEGNVISIDFVGAAVTSSVSGFGVTVTFSDYVFSSGISSYSDIAGISSYSDVAGISTYSEISGIATYSDVAGISTYSEVSGISTDVIGGIASVTSVLTGIITATQGFISVGNTTPIQILLVGDQLTFTAVGIGSTTLTLF